MPYGVSGAEKAPGDCFGTVESIVLMSLNQFETLARPVLQGAGNPAASDETSKVWKGAVYPKDSQVLLRNTISTEQ